MQETGGDSLDESEEVLHAVTAVLSVMDGNHDKVLKKDDLSKYMKSLGTLLISHVYLSAWTCLSCLNGTVPRTSSFTLLP